MSIEIIREQTRNFLKTKTPEILSIRGSWGAGKTFTWNNVLKEKKSNLPIGLDRYAYVSLFGCNSLHDLKLTIFANVINIKSNNHQANIDTFKKSIQDLGSSWGGKAFRFFQSHPLLKNFQSAIETASFLTLKEMIICFDDLERKGDGLKVREVLGLVLWLKEQHNCKVVVISNDKLLCESEEKELKTYREKVFDIDIFFDPTPEDCSEIAIPSNCDFSIKIKNYTNKIGIKNIRTIKRIFELSKKLQLLLEEFEENIVNQALETMAFLTWCYLHKDSEEVPCYDYVKNFSSSRVLSGEAQKEQEKIWNRLLVNYFRSGYFFPGLDDFDLEVAKGIENRYFDENNLLKEAQILHAKLLQENLRSGYHEAWSKFYYTFEQNDKEVLDALYRSSKENVKYISPSELAKTIQVFRTLRDDLRADELIKFYVNERKDERVLFKNPLGYTDDEILIQEFNLVNENLKAARQPEEVIHSLVGKNGWRPEDIEILSSLKADDFYQIFMNQNGEHLLEWIEVCLQFEKISNASEEQKIISKNAREALVRIGTQSQLNSLRVKAINI